jgi:hypothetical protein
VKIFNTCPTADHQSNPNSSGQDPASTLAREHRKTIKRDRRLKQRLVRKQASQQNPDESSSENKMAVLTAAPPTPKTLNELNTAAEMQIRADMERASQQPSSQDESASPAAAAAEPLQARAKPSRRHLRYRQRRKAWRQKHREQNDAVLQEAAAIKLPVD